MTSTIMNNLTATYLAELLQNQTTNNLSRRDSFLEEGFDQTSEPIAGNDSETGSSAMTPEADFNGDDDTLLSADVYTEAVNTVDHLIPVFQVFGIVVNVINIAVLTRRRMRSPTTSFLLAVSILQLVYILLHMPENLFNSFHAQSSSTRFYLLYSIYVSNYCLPCARRCMYVLQLFVSVERLLAVLVPLRARQFLLVRRPKVFILATPLLVFLAHIHVCLKLEVYHATTTGQGNKTTYSYRFTAAYERSPRLFDIVSIVLKSLFVYVSLLLLLVVNVAVLVVLRRYTGRRAQLTTNMDTTVARRREKQMTLTLLVSTLIFIALCLPTDSNSLVFNVIPGSYGPLIPKHRYLFFFIQKFGSLCFLLAFSTDFFTYIALSSMYQNTLLSMLGRRKEPEMVTYTRRFPPRKEEMTTSFHVIDSASHI